MANPQQRRKSRSGTSNKPSANAKRRQQAKLVKAPEIKGPDVLKKAWDPKLTVRQNYAKLGLLPSLEQHQSGGLERSDPYHPANLAAAAAAQAEASNKPKKGMARIVRDAEGNVVDIIEAEDNDDSTPWGRPLKDLVDSEESNENWMPPKLPTPAKGKEVIEALENLEAQAAPVVRHTSTAERSWLHDMVDKYGEDVEAMAKDRRINVHQKTAGEIRRAINKAGGFEAFA